MSYRLGLLMVLFMAGISWGMETESIDLKDYQDVFMSEDSVNDSVYYPDYFRDVDRLSYRNILAEIRFRLEFIAGLKPRLPFAACFEHQKLIESAIKSLKQKNGRAGFSRIDDALLSGDNSPFKGLLKPAGRRLSLNCSYKSIGDLEASGTVYCVYHGPAHESEFYQRNIDRFSQARPWLTAFDLVELIIFLPALISLPVIWMITRKLLEKKSV